MSGNRTIVTKIRAEMDQYQQQMKAGAASTEALAKAGEKVAQAQEKQKRAAQDLQAAELRLQEIRDKGGASAAQLASAESRVAAARDKDAAATKNLSAAVAEQGKAAEQASTRTGRLAQAAKENEKEWRTAGTAMVAAGTAVTALGVAALKTGIEYNTLQQTSRAALTTLLGGAEAANAQMDKLDEFARNSPFAKQVFISAQRQLLGFGMEASKVLPTLDAIQNAVAAFGGSNHDIASIAESIAKVESAGKISAVTFMELGRHGIDAAEMIGSEMGKTSAQIRADVTANALGADEAIEALTTAMSKRFGGAAENVKGTFVGAVDRIKAAWRDLSSELAEPLVGKEGGGMLVDLANATADLMRQFQALPGPVKSTVAGLVGVSAVASLAGGSLLLLTPRIIAAKEAFSGLNLASKGFGRSAMLWRGGAMAAGVTLASFAGTAGEADAGLGALAQSASLAAMGLSVGGPLGAAIGGSIGLLVGLSGAAMDATGDMAALTATLDPQTAALTENTFEWVKNQIITSPAGDAFAKAGISVATATDALLGNADALALVNDALSLSAKEQEGYSLQNQRTSDGLDGARDAFEQLSGQIGESKEKLLESNKATEESAEASKLAASASGDFAEKLRDQADAAREAAGFAMSLREAQIRFTESTIKAREANKDGAKVIRDSNDAIDVNAKATREADTALIDMARSADKVIESMREHGAGATELDSTLKAQRKSFLEVAMQMGYTKDEARELADEYGLIPKSVETKIEVQNEKATRAAVKGIQDGLSALQRTFTSRVDVDTSGAMGKLSAFRQALASASAQSSYGVLAPPKIGKADGGIVEYFADGGMRENHVAQIAPAGAWRVWAEPETGGEAYIPLAPAKRARSLDIWAETGERLGVEMFADGGITKKQKAAAEKKKKEAAARAAERRDLKFDWSRSLRRGWGDDAVDDLSGMYSAIDSLLELSRNKALGKRTRSNLAKTAKDAEKGLARLYDRADAIAERLEEARQVQESIASSLSGGFSVGSLLGKNEFGYDMPLSASSIASGAAGFAAKVRVFSGKLERARKAGIPPVLLMEIAELGVDEGGRALDALLSGSSHDIKIIQDAYRDIETYSMRSGQVVAKAFDLKDAGKNSALGMADGFIAGLESREGLLHDKMVQVAQDLEDAIYAGLGIKNPRAKAKKKAKGKVVRKGSAIVGFAGGGAIHGPGSSTSDDILIAASDNEHMWTAREAQAVGGHEVVYGMRAAAERAGLAGVHAYTSQAFGAGYAGSGSVKLAIDYDQLAAAMARQQINADIYVDVGINRPTSAKIVQQGTTELARRR